MGRPLKYGSETIVYTKRIPKDKLELVEIAVCNVIDILTGEIVSNTEVIDLSGFPEKYTNESIIEHRYEFESYKECDCKLENGLLRRGKIKCTKTKSEHKF